MAGLEVYSLAMMGARPPPSLNTTAHASSVLDHYEIIKIMLISAFSRLR